MINSVLIRKKLLFFSIFLALSVLVFYYFFVKDSIKFERMLDNSGHNLVQTRIETLYGTFDVSDKVIIDLIDSPAMQRIKNVHQYGIAYFLDNYKFYTRYEHCVGVWALLKRYGASLDEQIAGLLHDASHTVFSHLGDYIFNHKDGLASYQDNIHEWYLSKTTVPDILKKHGLSLEQVMHKNGKFFALEQDLPDLCADRIEYNIKGGLIEGLILKSDVEEILQDLQYQNERWFFNTPAIALKFAKIPLYLTEHEWGSIGSFLMNTWGADAIRKAMQIGLVTYDDVHFSTDDIIWQRLLASDDHDIKNAMKKIKSHKKLYKEVGVDFADYIVKTKFRGVNPWVKVNESFIRLTEIDSSYAAEYNQVLARLAQGWAIKIEKNEEINSTLKTNISSSK